MTLSRYRKKFRLFSVHYGWTIRRLEGVRLNRFDSKVNVQMNGANVTVTAIRIQLRNRLRLDHPTALSDTVSARR